MADVANKALLLQMAPVLVKTKKAMARAVGLCRQAKAIAVDCEGCKLSAEGKLCLIQVASAKPAMTAYRVSFCKGQSVC